VALTTVRRAAADHPPAHHHVVQFYDHAGELADRVVPYLAEALDAGGVGVVIATAEHGRAFAERLPGAGGRLRCADAGEAMAALMVDGGLARHRFEKLIGDRVRQAVDAAGGGPVHAYGEIVALMWADGFVAAALGLEGLWNDLGREVDFSLYCAYPRAIVDAAGYEAARAAVCRQHSAVVGPEPAAAPAGAPFRARVRTFDPVGSAPADARRFVTATLAGWSRIDRLDDAAVIVTELATNAVMHAGTEFTVTVSDRPDGTVRIGVSDRGGAPPRPRRAAPLEGSGRGLSLIAALAAAWGTERLPGGKVVWAELGG
jgi:hypothetical protein